MRRSHSPQGDASSKRTGRRWCGLPKGGNRTVAGEHDGTEDLATARLQQASQQLCNPAEADREAVRQAFGARLGDGGDRTLQCGTAFCWHRCEIPAGTTHICRMKKNRVYTVCNMDERNTVVQFYTILHAKKQRGYDACRLAWWCRSQGCAGCAPAAARS